MARLDVPTLQCDRCKIVTTDTRVMAGFEKIDHYGQSERHKMWDLCPKCWREFIDEFLKGTIFKIELPEVNSS